MTDNCQGILLQYFLDLEPTFNGNSSDHLLLQNGEQQDNEQQQDNERQHDLVEANGEKTAAQEEPEATVKTPKKDHAKESRAGGLEVNI